MTTRTTHTMRNGFCTECGETALWLAEHGADMVDANGCLAPHRSAADLHPGDIVRYDAANDWEVIEYQSETAKTVTFVCEYRRHDHPGGARKIGKRFAKTFRKTTRLELV